MCCILHGLLAERWLMVTFTTRFCWLNVGLRVQLQRSFVGWMLSYGCIYHCWAYVILLPGPPMVQCWQPTVGWMLSYGCIYHCWAYVILLPGPPMVQCGQPTVGPLTKCLQKPQLNFHLQHGFIGQTEPWPIVSISQLHKMNCWHFCSISIFQHKF